MAQLIWLSLALLVFVGGAEDVVVPQDSESTSSSPEPSVTSTNTKTITPTNTRTASLTGSRSFTSSVSSSPEPSKSFAPPDAPLMVGAPEPMDEDCFMLTYADEDNVNVITFSDFQSSSRTEGRLFVGGDAHLTAYSVGEALGPDESGTRDDLVVRGNLEFQTGSVLGSVKVCGNYTLSESYFKTLAITGNFYRQCGRFDFDGAYDYFKATNDVVCAMEDTGTIELGDMNDLTFSGTGEQQAEVFTVDCATMDPITMMYLQSGGPTVILNLNGDANGTCKFSGYFNMGPPTNVLINACNNVQEIHVEGVELAGSILAPDSHVMGDGGGILGQIVANTYQGEAGQDLEMFDICDSMSTGDAGGNANAPAPASLLEVDAGKGEFRSHLSTLFQKTDNAVHTNSDSLGLSNVKTLREYVLQKRNHHA